MAINKRSFIRKSQKLDVDVYNCGTYLGRATTRDIHIDGAFILIRGYAGEVYQNDTLKLHFISNDAKEKPICLNGLVVRSSSEGIGVLFSYCESEFKQLLKTVCKTIGVISNDEKMWKQHLSSLPSV